jgi:hypothetical protein
MSIHHDRRPELRLLARDRGEGKTTQAFAWVSNGKKVGGYPGWSRVLVLPNWQIFDHHRKEYWPLLEDYDHRVYAFEDWMNSMGANHDTDVCIDEINLLLGAQFRHMPGRLVAATITAWPWEEQTFRSWEQPYLMDEDDPRWGKVLR